MVFDVNVAMTWILFLAVFPMAFIWLRRAFKIFVKKNYSEVALKRGNPPANPKKWALLVGMVNLIAGGVCVWTIITVLFGLAPYSEWSAMAGITIWGKIFADWIIRIQAHPLQFGKKKTPDSGKTCPN